MLEQTNEHINISKLKRNADNISICMEKIVCEVFDMRQKCGNNK